MARNLPQPTEAEMEILQVLWVQGPTSVRTVHEALSDRREVGYTTTLKLMQIMVDKGLLRRDTSQRMHIYEAVVSEADTQHQFLSRFVDTIFRGSASQLVMQALGNHQASPTELEKIKDLIERLERDSQDPTQ